MGIADSMKKAAFSTAFSYIGKNPEENAPKLMAWVDKFAGDGPNSFPTQRAAVRKVINDKDNNMHHLVMDIMKDTDPEVLKATFMNFFLNANIIGWPKQEENRKKYNCNIPWAILLDPTSACNLHCTGCWAAEYGNRLNLTFDEIDSIITQGKELGVYMYIYTGGEPLVRKKDLIAICNKHSDCQFLSFTNGTLIDEEFADEMLRVKNFIPAISLEGFEAATDGRRGNGVFEKATRAMKLLHDKHLPFGISACYTSANIDSIASDEYIDYICSLGARFIWYFHYMPVGNDAAPQLLPNPQQREYMYHRIREIRATKPIFAMDFQNDGEYVGGCIAAATCTSTPTATSIRACSSITPTRTSATARCSKRCKARSSWPITTASRSTTIICVPARCWRTRRCCVKWSKRPARIPPTLNPRRRRITCAPSATNMPRTGRQRLIASGLAATTARPAAPAAERRTNDAHAVYFRECDQGSSR